jgi:hypothetical protein
MMKKSIGLLAALTLTACEPVPVVDFKDSMPTSDTTKVEMPKGSSGQGGLLTAEQALQGEGSGMAGLTAASILIVNGTTVWVLAGLGAVASQDPTSVNGDTAIFGPHTPVFSPTTWLLTVTRKANNVFEYTLDAKPKDAPDSQFAHVLTGEHEVAISDEGRPMRGFGEGHFTLQWDNVTRLSNQPSKRGTAEFRYSRNSPTDEVKVDVDFEEFVGDATAPTTALYRYAQVPGGKGSFQFAVDANVHWFDASRTALERLSIKSRWVESGEGRADVRVSGGDMSNPETLNECWDSRFRSTYMERTDSPEGWGNEAQNCVLKGAEYAN